MSTLITNIAELVTNSPEHAARGAAGSAGFGALSDAALVIEDAYVAWCGPASKAPAADRVVDAGGRAVLPGFVDSHSHLVFAGEPSGEFNALDSRTGELLWQFQSGSGHHSSPTTYLVDGRQYIAVPVGWGGWIEGFLPGMLGAGHGSALIVFALPE